MKKIISIALSIIMSVMALTSCANNATTSTTSDTIATTESPTQVKKEYTVYLTDFSDSLIGGRKDNIDLTSKSETKNPVPTEKLEINDRVYQGTYKYSKKSPYEGLDKDVFVYKDDTAEITYWVNSKTKKIEYYSIYSNEERDFSGRKVYSKQECIEMAKEYMKQYVPDIDKYDLTMAYDMKLSDRTVYDLNFQDFIGDLYIGNTVWIQINMCGDIEFFNYNFNIEDVEALKESGYLETIDWDAVDEAIEKRICDDFLSGGYYDTCTVVNNDEYKTTKTLIKMADGKYALKGTVHVSCNGRTPSDVIFFMYLD